MIKIYDFKGNLLVLQVGSVYPATQAHVKELTPSVQLPPFKHGLGLQSSISMQKRQFIDIYIIAFCK